MTKLDLRTIEDFNFDDYQGAGGKKPRALPMGSQVGAAELPDEAVPDILLDTNSDDRSMADLYMDGFKEEDSEEEFEKKLKMQQNTKDSRYPRLK